MRNRYVAVPCPACIARAAWIPCDHSTAFPLPGNNKAPDVPAGTTWHVWQPDLGGPGHTSFNDANPKRATLKRIFADNVTTFFKRNPAHINMTRKGSNCSACADMEESGVY